MIAYKGIKLIEQIKKPGRLHNSMKIILNILVLLVLNSCGFNDGDKNKNDQVTWHITDFSEKKSITLKPDSSRNYAAIQIKMTGSTNDTIKILRDAGYYDIKLSGKFDTIISSDYYGLYDHYFEFDPYRCSDGDLKVTIKMI